MVPSPASETGLIVGISNNRWDGARSSHNAPTFLSVEALDELNDERELSESPSSDNGQSTGVNLVARVWRLVVGAEVTWLRRVC